MPSAAYTLWEFYQILANLNIFDNISIEELKKQYYLKIDDEEIISAIRWHTIGYAEMTDFEKIIFKRK